MMRTHLKHVLSGLLLASGMSAASATAVLDVDQYKLSYDETTSFGYLSSWFGGGSSFGFNWKFADAVNVASLGPGTAIVTLPSFTLSANPGWSLSGPVTGFVGNLSFTEVGAATTGVSASAQVSVDGGPALLAGGNLARVVTGGTLDAFTLGYYQGNASAPFGAFSSLNVSSGVLTLQASGGTFASVAATSQSELRFTFSAVAAPVPEPESWALMLAGAGVLALKARRRKSDTA